MGASGSIGLDPALIVEDDAATQRRLSRLLAASTDGGCHIAIAGGVADLNALSRFTIEGYTKAIYRKLAVSSRTAAMFEAKSRGLLR
jgi:hypothetical protein